MPAPDPGNDISLEVLVRKMRGEIIRLSHLKGVPHLGSDLSCIDILAALYWRVLKIDPTCPMDPDRDRFILSKGHAARSLYVTLAYRGFFDVAQLETFTDPGGSLPEHPGLQCVPGVEAATGSLGHGLSLGLGMALAARMTRRASQIYVLLSDGECNEGSVWEAAMMSAAQQTSNLTAIVDFNKWQATGRSEAVLALSPLADKWRAFGWHVTEADGHDLAALADILLTNRGSGDRPTAIVAHTVKGKGVSFMEDDNNWHYRIPNAEEVATAFTELGLK